jgi:hypothetical protein
MSSAGRFKRAVLSNQGEYTLFSFWYFETLRLPDGLRITHRCRESRYQQPRDGQARHSPKLRYTVSHIHCRTGTAIPPNYVVECVTAQRNPPEVRIWRFRSVDCRRYWICPRIVSWLTRTTWFPHRRMGRTPAATRDRGGVRAGVVASRHRYVTCPLPCPHPC